MADDPLERARQAAAAAADPSATFGVKDGRRAITPTLAASMAFEPAWHTILSIEARRMTGEFTVAIGERHHMCADGWLAREGTGENARLWPISAPEFERAYTRRIDELVVALAKQIPAEMLRLAAEYQEREISRRQDSRMNTGMIDLEPE
jgi:hypothetical protein